MQMLDFIKLIGYGVRKLCRDIALIFYDDLEFRAMSLPRVAAGALTAAVGASWIGAQFCGHPFSGFEALCVLCGGVWAAYTFKRRMMPPDNNVAPVTGRSEGNDGTEDTGDNIGDADEEG